MSWITSLLTQVTALPYAARFRALRQAGIESRTKPKIAAELDGWEKGDWQQRFYCVQACTGSRDTARLRRMVNDSSRAISTLALMLLADFGEDAVLLELLAQLPHRRRLALLNRLRKRRRFGVIDRFLEAGFAAGMPRIGEMLSLGSSEAARRHLAKVEQTGGLRLWRSLARHQPRLAVEAMLERLSEADPPDALLLKYGQEVVVYGAKKRPELIAQLVRVLGKFLPLGQTRPGKALYQSPDAFAKIVLESEDSQSFSLQPVAHKLEPGLRLRVLREQPKALRVQGDWFGKLPWLERQAIYQELGKSWRDAEGFTPLELLSELPGRERVAEAERIGGLPELAARPQMQALYAGYLPWVQLKGIAERFLTHPEGEWRGWGWAALITGVRYHRAEAGSLLIMIRKRKFEQDPVRLVILQNLAALPAGIWKEQHLLDLAGIVREGLDATDLSPSSVLYLTGIVQKVIATHPDWAVQQLIRIYRERGNLGGYPLESRITDGQALILETAFLEVGRDWGRGNRVGWLYWFASALGKRLRVCTRLMKVLEELLGKESGYYDSSIVSLLHKHLAEAEFEKLSLRLIALHGSWVAIPTIFQFLHRHRQEKLEPYLRIPRFRMKGGDSVELVQLLPPGGYARYTLAQQTALAGTLNDIIRLPAVQDLPKDVWTMLCAITALARLPALDGKRLIELSKDRRAVIAEAGTRALGRLEGGQGLPTLIEGLGDERARIAIYALRQILADLPVEQVVGELSKAPLGKLTVAKEVIRLMGEYGGSQGFAWMIAVAKKIVHRDIQIAILRGLWDHLDQPEAWDLLREAARSEDGQILNGVARIPADCLSENARKQLIELLAGLASHPDTVIRLTVFKRFIELPLPDSEGRLLATALRALTAATGDERETAARVIAANATAEDARVIAARVGEMAGQRRALHDFARVISGEAMGNASMRRRLAPMAREVLEGLRGDPVTAGISLNLASGILGVEEFERELREVTGVGVPFSAVMAEAIAGLERFGQTRAREKLPELERRLGSSRDAEARLLAFYTLVTQGKDPDGWTEERRSRLEGYRRDASPVVAMRAQFFFEADKA